MRNVVSSRGKRRRVDPFGVGALAGAGTLAAHQLGYLAESGGNVSHSYLGVVGPAVVLLACVAAWFASLRVLRNDQGRLPSLGALAGMQIGLFVAMEVGERVSTNSLGTLVSAPVAAGLLLQPLVAWAALRLLAVGGRVLRAFVALARRRMVSSLVAITAPFDPFPSRLDRSCLRLRGPPAG